MIPAMAVVADATVRIKKVWSGTIAIPMITGLAHPVAAGCGRAHGTEGEQGGESRKSNQSTHGIFLLWSLFWKS
jgi:hypothetical protein